MIGIDVFVKNLDKQFYELVAKTNQNDFSILQ